MSNTKRSIGKFVKETLKRNREEKQKYCRTNKSQVVELRRRLNTLEREVSQTERDLRENERKRNNYEVKKGLVKGHYKKCMKLLNSKEPIDIFCGFRESKRLSKFSIEEKERMEKFEYAIANHTPEEIYSDSDRRKPLHENDPAKRVLEGVLAWVQMGGPQPDYIWDLYFLGEQMQKRTTNVKDYCAIISLKHPTIKKALIEGRKFSNNRSNNFEKFFIENQESFSDRYNLKDLRKIARDLSKEYRKNEH